MKRVAWLAAAVVVRAGAPGFAFLHVFGGSGQAARASVNAAQAGAARTTEQSALASAGRTVAAPAGTAAKSYSLTVAGVKRTYEVIAPRTALAKSAPVIVMLQGVGSTIPQEISRDQLAAYAAAGQAEIVYPTAEGESWNAGGCCGFAYKHKVNDQAFLKALVASVNPGNARKIYVAGYSNGARMAYRIACDDPGLFDAYAMANGGPPAACAVKKPVSLIQLAATDDPEIPYKPGDHGLATEKLPVTTLMDRMHTAGKCPAASATRRTQDLTLTTWSGCGGGTRLVFAVWDTGVHSFPRPPASKPGAAPVIWSFFTRAKLAPVPAA